MHVESMNCSHSQSSKVKMLFEKQSKQEILPAFEDIVDRNIAHDVAGVWGESLESILAKDVVSR